MIRVGTDPENENRLKVELEGKPFELIEEVNALLKDMCRAALTDSVDKAHLTSLLAFTAYVLQGELETADEFGYKEVRKRLLESFTKQLAEAVAEDDKG